MLKKYEKAFVEGEEQTSLFGLDDEDAALQSLLTAKMDSLIMELPKT